MQSFTLANFEGGAACSLFSGAPRPAGAAGFVPAVPITLLVFASQPGAFASKAFHPITATHASTVSLRPTMAVCDAAMNAAYRTH
jgi:hypothetical protein